MSTIPLDEAQKRLGELVKNLTVEQEIVITLDDKPVARLTSLPRPAGENSARFCVTSADELRDKLVEGTRELDDGAGVSREEAMRELRERAKARRPA